MTNSYATTSAPLLTLSLVGASIIFLVGCGSVHHNAQFDDAFSPTAGTKIEIGQVTNESGESFEIDIEGMFTNALAEELGSENLLWVGAGSSDRLILTTTIIEYQRGNAFKRWLLPGWGSTVLSVHCELKEAPAGGTTIPDVSSAGPRVAGAGAGLVGSIEARRSVSIGGGLSIGAWRTIMNSVAEDVIEELESGVTR